MENKMEGDPWRRHATEAGGFATGPRAQGHARLRALRGKPRSGPHVSHGQKVGARALA
jgi:hypothetical protein